MHFGWKEWLSQGHSLERTWDVWRPVRRPVWLEYDGPAGRYRREGWGIDQEQRLLCLLDSHKIFRSYCKYNEESLKSLKHQCDPNRVNNFLFNGKYTCC